MRKKILRVILLTIAIIIIAVCGLFFTQMMTIQKILVDGSQKASDRVKSMSEDAMTAEISEYLKESASARAEIADEEFADVLSSSKSIAACASYIYENRDKYGKSTLPHYTSQNYGEYGTVCAYGEGVDPESEEVQSELALISNLQGSLKAINELNPAIATSYFATETGLYVGNEIISDINVYSNEKPVLFDGRERPWYKEAVEEGGAVFTGIIEDADTGRSAVTCGVPVYKDGVLIGVAGAGMYLDIIRENIDSYRIGADGFACVVNSQGQVLFSGTDTGPLAVSDDADNDLRTSSNKTLATLTNDALAGVSGIRLIRLDGEEYYAAFEPMTTVGWAYFTVLPKGEVTKPTKDLLAELNKNDMEQKDFVASSILSSILYGIILLLLVGLLASIASRRLANKLSDPIVMLTDKVSKLEGDSLDFEWDTDTGDEVQKLAESFGSMTSRMKQYIKDITEITAEKERIGAELSVATNIQASMLPSVFPAFPNRREFDLYATMEPAKEVGGDFYDFFLIDDSHLGLVIADVSGKGVPAALFMVIAKTLIKNHAQEGESVDDVLAISNNQLCEGNGEEMFVTAWIGVIDLKTGVMRYCDAGHENPYIIHSDNTVEMLVPPKKRPPLAAMEGMKYIPNETTLRKGDSLYLYTDGVPEATNTDNELYGTDRLMRVLEEKGNEELSALLHDIRKDVDEFVGDAPQFDDITMLAFRLNGFTGEESNEAV